MAFASGSLNLYLSSYGIGVNSSMDLSLTGGDVGVSGAYGAVFLSLTGASGTTTSEFPLFLAGPASAGVSGSLPLWLEGGTTPLTGSVPLFLANSGFYGTVPLYLSGAGETPGSTPCNSYMNLFLQRNEGSFVPLYLRGGPDESAASGVALYLEGNAPASGIVPLYLSGVGVLTGSVRIYARGF